MGELEYIYMDYAASTPVLKEVVEECVLYYTSFYSNPSNNIHKGSLNALDAVKKATEQVKQLLGAWDSEVVYTSGATESINMVLKGIYQQHGHIKNQIITCKSEHKAVLAVCDYLQSIGADIKYLGVNDQGGVSIEELEKTINDQTLAVCLMAVNNETGVVHDIEEISNVCLEKGARFICDATQAVGKLPVDLGKVPVDALIFSGHKMYAPKGIGALVLKRDFKVASLIHGGGQQNNLRSGTLNVPGIVALGKAAEILNKNILKEFDRLKELQQCFENELKSTGKVEVVGSYTQRSPYISNLRFLEHEREDIIFPLSKKLYFSSGSACNSEIVEPSHVLRSMGFGDEVADRCLRFSFGTQTTEIEVKEALNLIHKELDKISIIGS